MLVLARNRTLFTIVQSSVGVIAAAAAAAAAIAAAVAQFCLMDQCLRSCSRLCGAA